jgi:hypothetical protein
MILAGLCGILLFSEGVGLGLLAREANAEPVVTVRLCRSEKRIEFEEERGKCAPVVGEVMWSILYYQILIAMS